MVGALGVVVAYEVLRMLVALFVSRDAARTMIGFDPHVIGRLAWVPAPVGIVLSPMLPALVVVLLVERRIPGRTEEPGVAVSANVTEDLCWIVFGLTIALPLLRFEAGVVKLAYDAHLRFLTVDPVAAFPTAARVALGVVVFDFAGWASHVLRHHVGGLWRLHAVHHSQRWLNPFTAYRVHPVERLLVWGMTYTALYAVGLSAVTATGVVLALDIHGLVVHSNLRTNFGPLRYVIVTPQSHRVHHSIEPRHLNKNLGIYLSVWDYLFGTQYRGYDEYPETGISDARFPLLGAVSPGSALRGWAAQLAYPLRRHSLAG